MGFQFICVLCHFQQYFNNILAFRFIGGRTRRKMYPTGIDLTNIAVIGIGFNSIYIYLSTISSRPRPPCSCTRPYITYFISFFFLKKVGDIHYKFRRTWFVIITYIIPLSVWSLHGTVHSLIHNNLRSVVNNRGFHFHIVSFNMNVALIAGVVSQSGLPVLYCFV
jgi:hypothetical protein